MHYCTKCGKELHADAHFCASCGTPAEPQSSTGNNSHTERKQVFAGAITNCPECGEQITTDTTKCPVCGFMIEKRNVSACLDAFIKQFTSFEEDKAKREFIESYAVPNNKEDIRDLLNYAANQRDKNYVDDVSKVYWVDTWNNKCRQIVNQGFDTFGMDEGFSAWLKNYKTGIETSSAENEKLKKKLHSIEAGKQRAASAKKFLKGFGVAVAILAVLGGAGFGIKSCTDKRAAEKQRLAEEEALRQQELAQVKTEMINLLAKEVTIPKESISLGGLLSTYCEGIGDATITYRYEEHDYHDEFHCDISGVVSIPVRLKKDFAAAYKQQYEAFIKATFDTTERKISDYYISKKVEIKDSLFRYHSEHVLSLDTFLGADVGEAFKLVESGSVEYHGEYYKTKAKLKNKTADILALYNTMKDKAQNPPKTVSLSMTASLKSQLNQYSTEKGYDSQSVDIY